MKKRILFEVGEKKVGPVSRLIGAAVVHVIETGQGRRQIFVSVVKTLQPQANLLQVVGALRAGGGFTHLLHGGNQ